MARLTKQETKLHQQTLDLVHSDKILTFDEKEFILQNYQGDGVEEPVLSLHLPILHGTLLLTLVALVGV